MLTLSIAPAVLGLRNDVPEVDPAQYADVARRMLDTGDWLHLRDQNGPFWNKPPLTMWLQAAGMAVFGVDAFAVRLPGLFFAVLTMAATFFIGRSLGSFRRGLLAAGLVGGALSTHTMVLDPKVDASLMAMTTVAIALMLEGRQRPGLRWLAWLVAGLAVLAKGPIGLGIPVLALGPEVVRSSWAPGGLARRVWAVAPLGAVLSAAVAAPFYLATHESTGDDGVLYMLWLQGFGRLFGKSGFLDDTTPFFFVHTALWVFLPLTPVLVLALGRRVRALARDRRLPGDVSRMPVWWFGLTFLVLSFSTYKLPQYLYPLTPAVALLVAEELERIDERHVKRWWWVFFAFALGAVPFALVVFLFAFPTGPWLSTGWLVVVTLPAVALFWLRERLAARDALAVAAVGSLTGSMALFAGYVQPRMLEFQPSRAVGALVRELDPDSRVLPCVFVAPDFSYSFAARRDASYVMPDGLKSLVGEGRARVALVGPDGPFEALENEGLAVEVIASWNTFLISRPTPNFLRETTRAETLRKVSLVKVSLKR